MSSQDRLLSDEELRKALVVLLYNASDERENKTVGQATDELFELINTQKRLYAESVIGEDEEHSEYCNREQPKLGWCVCKEGTRNGLRAEQRAKLTTNKSKEK